ncbi:hypothetical protein M8J75_010691 [Diaphorina citri]|nr:hypothetical protein M8J75_010691 [Diaphorina citri]
MCSLQRSLVGHPEDQYTQNFQKLNCELTAVISNPQYRAAICISSVSTPSHLSRNYHQFQAFSFGRLCFCASITTATDDPVSLINTPYRNHKNNITPNKKLSVELNKVKLYMCTQVYLTF